MPQLGPGGVRCGSLGAIGTERSSGPQAAPTSATLTHRQVLIIFSGLMLGMLLAALDQTIVATALPTITGELGGLDHLSWVVTAYLLAATVSNPLYGKLGDLFGRKRVFQSAIVVFLAGSVLCGLAQDFNQLIAFRAVQGLGGGGLIVLAQAIIADIVTPRERGRYQGYFGSVFGIASVAGPLLGGFFTDHLTWRWVFYINVPFGIAALFVTSAVLPTGRRRGTPRIDYAGAAVLTAATTSIVLVTTWGGTQHRWASPVIVGLIAAAAVLVGALVVTERRTEEPVIPIRLFAMRTVSLATSISFVIGVAMFGAIAFLPLFLQVVNGTSATKSGLLLIPLMLGMLTASAGTGQVITRTGRYKPFPVVGIAVAAVALVLLSTMDAGTSRGTTTAFMLMLGAGLGCCLQPLVVGTQNVVPRRDLGAATSMVSFCRSMGGAVGVAMFGALFTSDLRRRLDGTSIEVDEGSTFTLESVRRLPAGQRAQVVGDIAESLSGVFFYAVPLLGVGFVLALLVHETPLRTTHESAVPASDGREGASMSTAR